MEAQGGGRRAGDRGGGGDGDGGGGGSASIAKHLAKQGQVLKWLQDFCDKVEERAKGAAAEVNGLLEEAGALELDMKITMISFGNLTRERFIEHKISDEDSVHAKMSEGMQGSLQSQVPAQDYERDILPRYKEALHIGLSSCKDHFRSKGRSTTSVFRAMSVYGPLPHIIGSEEYNHDNSCGLADDVQPLNDDFSWLREFQSESSDSGPVDMSESQIFSAQQGYEKGETDSVVSAARQFKAMLEAALLNPYKFYDDSRIPAQDASIGDMRTSEDPVMLTVTSEAASGKSAQQDNYEERGLFASLQNPDTNAHGIYSALVREGLFGTGDEILSTDTVESAGNPVSIPASGLANLGISDPTERTISINETAPNEWGNLIKEDGALPSSKDEEDDQNDAHSARSPDQEDSVSGLS